MLVSWRARESEKQARCREQNESTARARAAAAPAEGGASSFRCECGDADCSSAITLTLPKYESVRGHPTHFAVAQSHENPQSERVIEENEGFAVVEVVTGDEVKLARRSDPRQRRDEQSWARAHSGKPGEGSEPEPGLRGTAAEHRPSATRPTRAWRTSPPLGTQRSS